MGRHSPHRVPSSAQHPPQPLLLLCLPAARGLQRCGNHCFGPWERGSGAQSRRSVTLAMSAWLPWQPCELPFSSAFPRVRSHTAPGSRGPLLPCTLLPARAACSQAALPLPALPGFLLAQRVPALAGAGERSFLAPGSREPAAGLSAGRCLVPRQALGFVTHGRALCLGIAPALREGAVGPVWVCLVPVGLGRRRCSGAGGREGCAFPHSWPRGQDPGAGSPPVPVAGAPRERSRAGGISIACPELSRLTGISRGWREAQRPCLCPVHGAGSACRGCAGIGARDPRPTSGGRGGIPRSPRLARAALCLGAPSFMQCWLLRDHRLPMLNALIRRDKTALKIPHCWPPAGARGLPGGRQPGAGGLPGSSQTPRPLSGFEPAAGASGVERAGVQARSGGDWLGLARGLLQLELPCQSRLPRLQPERGVLRLPCLHPACRPRRRGAGCSAARHLPGLCLLLPAASELVVSCAGPPQHGDSQRALRLQFPGLPLPLSGHQGR